MKALSWVRAQPKTLASAAGVAIGALTITTMAVAYDGFPTTKVDLNDAGVWLTKTSSLLVGHFNHESTVIDGGLRTIGEDYDVAQDAGSVLVVDQGNDTMAKVDPARMALTDSAAIPADAKVVLGARTAAVLDRESGDLWVVPMNSVAGFDFKGSDAHAELDENADVAIGRDGTVYGLSAVRGEIVTIPVDPQGEPIEAKTSSVGEIDDAERPSLTVVGTAPVVLDAAAGVLTTPGGFRTELDGAEFGPGVDLVLQQPSAQSDTVAVAGRSQLIQVPLDGGEPVVTQSGGEGSPAAPVFLRGCTYAAWGGSAKFLRDCAGDSQDVTAEIPGGEESTRMVFRVNRDVIVLNDVFSGAAWLATDSLQRVDDWSVLTPPEGETEDQEDTTQETVETSLPERKEENTPPIAEDDKLGVRPGGTTMLPVLDNDNDSDGDVLVASLVGRHPPIGQVQPVLNGAALQIMVPEDASGTATFEYEINDGRKGKDSASVTATVFDWDRNTAPRPKRTIKLAVESGGAVSYNVLPDWLDPEGDDLYLQSVLAAPGDEVDFSTDGQITYRAIASLQGRKNIEIVVSDALGKTASGTILLDVKPAGTSVPVTNADHVITRAGETVTVAPTANDTSSGRDPLRLTRVNDVDGATVLPDYPNKQFTFRSGATGVYYVQYQVSAGISDAKGLVRIDVLDKQESDLPPVAVRDVALLPKGSEALVGVLANDSDPSGGVLVIQSVTVPPHSGVAVSVLNHETLRISDQGALDEPVKITYRISNGSKSAEGDVTVVPIPAPSKILPPVAYDDEAVVRVGDVVTIPVLDNDSHPNGDVIHVAPDLVEPLVEKEHGEAFVSQDTVRFRAGSEPRTVYLTYEVVDSMGQKAGGHVTVQILPVDAETNAAPRPHDLTARALSGSKINIPIPLDGIDADGDSIELLGQAVAPTKGRITETGSNYLEYEAFADSSGVDAFTYRVRDRLGQEGTATIRVGIAPPEAMNQAPYAVKDAVVSRPGRSVAVPVLVNDSDPEGDQIALVTNGLELPEQAGLTASVSGDRVIVEVPDRELEASLQYTIRDAKGAEATAPILVTVDEDVPLMTPIARDDRVRVEDLKGDLTVDLDILGNDEDPDGTVEGLRVEAEAGARLIGDGKARVTVGEKRQLIRYTVTDQDDRVASAFIFVPAVSELRPVLTSTKPVEVRSGETKVLPLAEYVTVAGGGTVRITEAALVSAGHANGDNLIKDEHTLVYTSEAGYFGKDALNFEVTDGKTVEDPEGRRSTLSIPILVLPPENQQPVFVNGQISVAPGEKATSLDLAALTTDPDKADAGRIEYRIATQPGDGVSARLDGTELMVEASTTTPKGTATTVGLSITDGTTEPIQGTVAVSVTASTRSLAVASPDTVDEADQGKTITVDALANDINPFQDDGVPLKLLTAFVESGEGTAEIAGDQVRITPGAKFVGVMVVRYRIQDATKDADREVDGRITVIVQGVPDAPGTPRVAAVEDRTVVLSWSAPSNNGAEIDSYTVTSVAGRPYTKTCESTTCTLDGLTNNVEYTFQVTAHNRVGDGPPSPQSEPARPDVRPETPLPPTLAFGDQSLDVRWETPVSNGSPVKSYTLQISPAPLRGASEKTEVTGNQLTWEGLENGTSYQVRVQAHNDAPDPSSFSNWSAQEVPAGKPGTVTAPRVTSAPSVGSEAQMTIDWDDAHPNGDPVSNYDLLIYRGGTLYNTVAAGTATSKTVSVPTNSADYTYAVQSENKAGKSAVSPQSAPQRAFGTPGAPTNVKAAPGDNRITITSYSMPDSALNGARREEIRYQYLISNGSWTNWNGGTIPVTNGNGRTYTVQLRAYSVVDGQQSQPGPASDPSNAVVPYGPVNTPGASAWAEGATGVRVAWSAPAENGRSISRVEINVDGTGWRTAPAMTGNELVGGGYSQKHWIQVRAFDSANPQQVSQIAYAEAYSNPAPPPPPAPRAWVTAGQFLGTAGNCQDGTCTRFHLNTNETFPYGNHVVSCESNRFASGWSVKTYTFGANASFDLSCYHGAKSPQYSGTVVWVKIDGVDYEQSGW